MLLVMTTREGINLGEPGEKYAQIGPWMGPMPPQIQTHLRRMFRRARWQLRMQLDDPWDGPEFQAICRNIIRAYVAVYTPNSKALTLLGETVDGISIVLPTRDGECNVPVFICDSMHDENDLDAYLKKTQPALGENGGTGVQVGVPSVHVPGVRD